MVEFRHQFIMPFFRPNPRHLRSALASLMITSVLLPAMAGADVLYDGYSKILLDGQHVGFVILKYDFDVKKKEFSAEYFVKTDKRGGNVTESLRAKATETLKPISFQYTELAGDSTKTIDATFKGETMTAKVVENGKTQTLQKKAPKGTFLAIFLAYVMLQGKDGIKKGVKYNYQAIAEEDGGSYSGEAYIAGEEAILGINAFKVLNTFKGEQFVSYYTYKGEVIATRSPVKKMASELVANPTEATEGQVLNTKSLEQVFGTVPRGQDNPLSKRSLMPEAAPALSANKASDKSTDRSSDKVPAKPSTPTSTPGGP